MLPPLVLQVEFSVTNIVVGIFGEILALELGTAVCFRDQFFYDGNARQVRVVIYIFLLMC